MDVKRGVLVAIFALVVLGMSVRVSKAACDGATVSIHPTARVNENVMCGTDVFIEGDVRIDAYDPFPPADAFQTFIGSGTVIHSGSRIGSGVSIGIGCEIGPNATIGDDAILGDRCILRDGSRVDDGADLGNDVLLGNDARVKADIVIPSSVVILAGVTISLSLNKDVLSFLITIDGTPVFLNPGMLQSSLNADATQNPLTGVITLSIKPPCSSPTQFVECSVFASMPRIIIPGGILQTVEVEIIESSPPTSASDLAKWYPSLMSRFEERSCRIARTRLVPGGRTFLELTQYRQTNFAVDLPVAPLGFTSSDDIVVECRNLQSAFAEDF